MKLSMAYCILILLLAGCSADVSLHSAEEFYAPNVPTAVDNTDTDQNPPPSVKEELKCEVPIIDLDHSPNFVPQNSIRVYLNEVKYPEAKCNDGTQAAYVIRPGFGVAKNRWVVWLDGGGACVDEAECTLRYNENPFYLTSRPTVLKTWGFNDGIQSADPMHNEDFYDATIVKVHYCTSDAWNGNKLPDFSKPGEIPESWYFHGHAIVRDVFEDLKTKGLMDAKELLFMGSSAGALGVFMNANSVAKQISPATRFVTSFDAGFRIDPPGYDPASPDAISDSPVSPNKSRDRAGFLLWEAVGDMLCAALGGGIEVLLECNQPTRLSKPEGMLKIPMFVRQSLNDGVYLKGLGLDLRKNNPPDKESAYRLFYAEQMRLELKATSQFVSSYATLDTQHGVMETEVFYSKQEVFDTGSDQKQLSIMKAMGLWYRNPCQHNLLIQ